MRVSVFFALAWGAAIGTLGGLIGLGGAEFRLPVLLGVFALGAHAAVRLNLLMSLVTLIAAAIARIALGTTPDLLPHAPEILALAVAAMAAAWFGAGLLARIDAARLMRIIAILLAGIGLLLLIEAAAGDALHLGAEPGGWWRAPAGVAAGVGIGLISSLLGVAGGELIIPTLTFVFGLDIRAAGSASLIISIPAVLVGAIRHARAGGYADRAMVLGVGLPMAAGSVIGAMAGAAVVPWVPAGVLEAILGLILVMSAAKLWRSARPLTTPAPDRPRSGRTAAPR